MRREFRLPWPPSVNHYTGYRVQKRRDGKPYVQPYTTSEARDYWYLVKEAVGRSDPIETLCRITLRVHPPDRRLRDLDNVLKCVFDSLQHARVVRDDSQFRAFSVEEKEPVKGGAIGVVIERYEVAQPELF